MCFLHRLPNHMLSFLFGSVTISETDFTSKLNMLLLLDRVCPHLKTGNIFNLPVKSVSQIVTDSNKIDSISFGTIGCCRIMRLIQKT